MHTSIDKNNRRKPKPNPVYTGAFPVSQAFGSYNSYLNYILKNRTTSVESLLHLPPNNSPSSPIFYEP